MLRTESQAGQRAVAGQLAQGQVDLEAGPFTAIGVNLRCELGWQTFTPNESQKRSLRIRVRDHYSRGVVGPVLECDTGGLASVDVDACHFRVGSNFDA